MVCTDDFDASCFGVNFDFILAQSLFTHLTFNHLRVALERLANTTFSGSRFYATFFEIAEDESSAAPKKHQPGDVQTFGDRDPYHLRVSDLTYACIHLPWEFKTVAAWGHPRGQKIATFIRI